MKRMIAVVCVLILAFVAGLALYARREMGKMPSEAELKTYEKLPYFKDGEFQSPQKLVYDFDNVRNGPANWARFLMKSPFAPEKPLPRIELKSKDFADKPGEFVLYWLGHSSAIIELDGKRLLFDPVFGNAAPLPLAVPRYGKAPLSREDLLAIDYVVITHNHYDHLERRTVQALKLSRFIVPLGVGAALRGWGVPDENIRELGWNDTFDKEGLRVIAMPAVHYSGRGLGDRNKTLWNSYILQSGGKSIYWVGDTGYGSHFKTIGDKYGPFDLATVEIDGWNTGWPNTHMFPEEAAKAMQELKAKNVVPVHWAVFDLALHPWHESIDMFAEALKGSGIGLLTPLMGQKIIPGESKTEKWW